MSVGDQSHAVSPIRVAMVLGRDGVGGSESQAHALVRGLRSAGVEVDFFVIEGDGSNKVLPSDGARVLISKRRRGIRGIWTMAVALARLRSVFRNGNYTAVHGVMSRAYVLVPLAAYSLRSRPMIVTWRRNLGIHLAQRSAASALERIASALTDVMVCNSDEVRNYWIERGHARPSKTLVVRNLLESWRFDAVVPQAPSEGGSRLLAVGGLKPVKGFDLLIDAAADLRRAGHRVDVVIVGDGECRGSLVMQAEQAGVPLLLPGHVADPRSWLASADVYVQPSYSEGQSNAIIEAMAQGVPIVATAVGGSTDLLEGVGTTVPSGDRAELTTAIAMLLVDAEKRTEMGRAAKDRARDTFDVSEIVSQHIAIYSRQRRRDGVEVRRLGGNRFRGSGLK